MDAPTSKQRMKVNRQDGDDEGNYMKLLPFSEVIFAPHNKLENIAYDSEVSNTIHYLPKLQNVFPTAQKMKWKLYKDSCLWQNVR